MPKQGSKSGKSSKTARVLNLLTDPDAVEDAAEENEAPEKPANNAKLADDRKTQAKIRGALEMELAGEAPIAPVRAKPVPPKPAPLRKPMPAELPEIDDEEAEDELPAERPAAPARRPIPPKPAAAAPAAPASPTSPVRETPAPKEESPVPAPAPKFSVPTPQEPMQAAMAELRSAVEKDPDEYICYNVTQALVEDKADKYIRMFGLCSCNRCRIDVIALALSNLPAKYVVAKPDELIPRLSMYEQKYNAAVVTQVMSACKKVLDRPHHVREQN